MGPPTEPCLILVVDDDDVIRTILSELLEDEGYDILKAEHGRAALDLLQQDRLPRLIVLDVQMLVMNGAEFRRAQLEDSHLAHIPVVVFTARGRAEAVALAPFAYLGPPFSAEEFLSVVAQTCT